MKRLWVYEWAAVLVGFSLWNSPRLCGFQVRKNERMKKNIMGQSKIKLKRVKTLYLSWGKKGNTLNKAKIRSDRTSFSFILSLSFTGMGFHPLKSNLNPLIFHNHLQKLWLPNPIFNSLAPPLPCKCFEICLSASNCLSL